jgi:hypothetical protein
VSLLRSDEDHGARSTQVCQEKRTAKEFRLRDAGQSAARYRARRPQVRCATDEQQALTQLQSQWSQFRASDEAQCIVETNIGGTPSYVDLRRLQGRADR